MQMLMLVIAEADVKPNTAVWTRVASQLGDITPSAVRYAMVAFVFQYPTSLY